MSKVTIRQVESGAINVGGQVVRHNITVSGDQEICDWSATAIAELTEDDLAPLIASAPELILLGTGRSPEFPARELVFSLARQGIGLEAMDTAAACRTFNILVSEGRRVAAALIVSD